MLIDRTKITKKKTHFTENYIPIKNSLKIYYGKVKWRKKMDILDELIFTVLTQNTSDINAEKSFGNLKLAYKSWEEIITSPNLKLEKTIRSGGLAKQKSERIKKILSEIYTRLEKFDLSILKTMSYDEVKNWLISLPGVGPKTTAVVMSFALQLPAFPVDTHIHRISKRLGFIKNKTSAEKAHIIMEKLVPPQDKFYFHILLITHGRKICKAINPKCSSCPISLYCPSANL